MLNQCLLLFISLILVNIVKSRGASLSPLNGKHLRCILTEFPMTVIVKRNETGHVVELNGPLIEQTAMLSKMFHFSYEYLAVKITQIDDLPSGTGAISYLKTNAADYLLTATIGTPHRLRDTDFSASFYEGALSILVPFPRKKLNISASFAPFPMKAWILILVTASSSLLYIYCCGGLGILRNTNPRFLNNIEKMPKQSGAWVFSFVLGNLVSQGQSCKSSSLTIRIVAGTWCVGCFFLVQIYSSTLTSHLMESNQKPIVNSVQELVNHPDVQLTADRGMAADILLVNTDYGKFKRFGDVLKRNSNLRCNQTDDCLQSVRSNGFIGYCAATANLQMIMNADLKSVGICRYYMIQDTLFSTSAFTLLHKHSPYTETISRGILRLRQVGLYDVWLSWLVPEPRECMQINQKDGKRKIRITLNHLSSAFVILLAGTALSILVFVFEKIVSLWRERNSPLI